MGTHFSRAFREKWEASQTAVEQSPRLEDMPAGPERRYGGGHLHFITASCYRRRKLMASSLRCALFEQVLEDVRQRYQLVVPGTW